MQICNPFLIYGYVSPEYFCDRETETNKLISALHNGRNITLMSPRRMGKSGLIHNAFYQILQQNENARCIYVDIYATSSIEDFVKAFGEAVLNQRKSLSEKAKELFMSVLTHCKITYRHDALLGGQIGLEFKKDDASATLGDIFSYLGQMEEECFIAIDEFQQIAEYDDENIEALLRTYIQKYPQLHFVFSGSKNHLMSTIFDNPHRPFYRSTEKMPLYVIPEQTYYKFVSDKLSHNMTILPEDIFHQVYTIFNGHTWYIQFIFNKVYEQSPAVVDESVIKDCLIDIVHSNADDYQKQYRMLTKNQQQLLKAIAAESNVDAINSSVFISKYNLKGTSSINKALSYLIDNEFVYKYDEGYQVYDRFMALWLA